MKKTLCLCPTTIRINVPTVIEKSHEKAPGMPDERMMNKEPMVMPIAMPPAKQVIVNSRRRNGLGKNVDMLAWSAEGGEMFNEAA